MVFKAIRKPSANHPQKPKTIRKTIRKIRLTPTTNNSNMKKDGCRRPVSP